MSRFLDEQVECPYCGDRRNRAVAASINAERSPALREAILEGELQRVECPACGQRFCIGAPFAYIDVPRGEWVLVYGEDAVESWRDLEPSAEAAWLVAAGPRAPPVARELFAGAKRRAVFGSLALTEKVVAWAAGLDDGVLEALKFLTFGPMARGVPIGPDHHVRLTDVTGGELFFLSGGEGLGIEHWGVDRGSYDAVAERCAAGDPLYARLTEGPFVDIGRLTVPGDRTIDLPVDGRSIY